jgi:hypothetical protein
MFEVAVSECEMRLVLGSLVLLVLPFAAVACDDEAERDEEGTVVEGGDESVFDLQVGDCYNEATEDVGEVEDVGAVPCSEPHDFEVYFAFDMTETDYPGQDEAFLTGQDRCIEEFEDFVGIPYDESVLDIFVLAPTSESWDRGDREILCSVYALDESKLTGSMQGTAE